MEIFNAVLVKIVHAAVAKGDNPRMEVESTDYSSVELIMEIITSMKIPDLGGKPIRR